MVADWARWHFGHTLRFPSNSNEAVLLRYHIRRAPQGYTPPAQACCEGAQVSIALPEYKDKPWPAWCYLSERTGGRALRQALRALMLMQLWIDMRQYLLHGGLEIALEQWCKDNGIVRHEWRVKKEYYQMRKRYEAAERPIRLIKRR